MKTLGKLNISSEKFINNEELRTLKGGYDGTGCCECHVVMQGVVGYIVGSTISTCSGDCYYTYGGWGVWKCLV